MSPTTPPPSATTHASRAKRLVINSQADFPPPLAGEGQGGGDISVVAMPVADTCKEVADGLVIRTVPRDSLVIAVGPWSFSREALARALATVAGRESQVDSLVALCEISGVRVRVIRRP